MAVAVLLLAVAAFVLRSGSTVTAASTVNPEVTIECAGSTSASTDECLSWGDSLLRTGPPSSTFEWDDLARIVLQRPMWGLSSTCEVAYFISRYPDEAI